MGPKLTDEERKARRKARVRKYFLANKEKVYATRIRNGSARASERKRRERARQFLRDVKDVPCVDCKRRYPHYVMEFDHVGEKKFKVSHIHRARNRLDVLAEEIAACDIVCANCHRVRTWRRAPYGDTETSSRDPRRTVRK